MQKALKIESLRPARGAKKKPRRVGRGNGSGQGTTAGRGNKGQKSRSGVSFPAYFEGGQMPFVRRVPKRGFHSRSHKEFNLVKVGALADFEAGTAVTPEFLAEKGLVRKNDLPVKILGDGDISHALEVTAHAFTRTATEKIQKAGGTTTVIR